MPNICMIPFDNDPQGTVFHSCCGKNICNGCIYKNICAELDKDSEVGLCVFCRRQLEVGNRTKVIKKLMKNNNPDAYMKMAERYKKGINGVLQSDTRSLELLIRAAELGLTRAYFMIGLYYQGGVAVEQNKSKSMEIFEVAAKKGSVQAHRKLAGLSWINGNNQKRMP